jgi:quercetin dioxygenase-like cupin family protein
MPDAEVQTLSEMVAYQPGSVVSRKILGGKRGNVTLFAFAQGEGLTEHTSPYAALVVILDGEAVIRIGGEPYAVSAGETITLPAAVPHALDAEVPFKMMLVMIRDGD